MSKSGKTDIILVQGDITQQAVDVIVNAANSALAVGGGVDGAIHRAGGPSISRETRESYPGGCETGSAVLSGAGDLPAKWIAHAVGPTWQGGGNGEEELLSAAYRRALELASEVGAKSVAFPAISTGIYGYPIYQAAKTAIGAVKDFLKIQTGSSVEEVRFVLFSDDSYAVFKSVLNEE